MPARRVGINGEVLQWAMSEASVSAGALAARTGVVEATVEAWIRGESSPTTGQFRKIADVLRRPTSVFFLPSAPSSTSSAIGLRRAQGRDSRDLTPDESRLVRRGRRLQKLLAWLQQHALAEPTPVPSIEPGSDARYAGALIRGWLGIAVSEQLEWASAKEAFDSWRDRFEERGVVVLQLQLGPDGVRGFSLPDPVAPVVAVNTGDNYQARIFTAFHEMAHLSSNTAAACLERTGNDDNAWIERWCEQVASAALIPQEMLAEIFVDLSTRPGFSAFEIAGAIADRFHVSLRAAAVALIRANLLGQEVYGEIEERVPALDREKGFARGRPQTASQRRLGELGPRAVSLVISAIDGQLLTERDARDYLRLDGEEIAEIASAVGAQR